MKIKLKKSNHVKIIFIFFTLAVALTNVEKFAFKNYDTILTVSDFQNKELERAENIYNLPKKITYCGLFLLRIFKKNFLDQKMDKYITYAPSWSRDKKSSKIIPSTSLKDYLTVFVTIGLS